jgi:hypothetical protein
MEVFLFACKVELLDGDFSVVLTTSFVLLTLHAVIAPHHRAQLRYVSSL